VHLTDKTVIPSNRQYFIAPIRYNSRTSHGREQVIHREGSLGCRDSTFSKFWMEVVARLYRRSNAPDLRIRGAIDSDRSRIGGGTSSSQNEQAGLPESGRAGDGSIHDFLVYPRMAVPVLVPLRSGQVALCR